LHLKKDEVLRLQAASGDIPAAAAKSEAWADEIAAQLHAESPWLAPATEVLWHSLRRSARLGEPIKVSPLIINGPPGVGKTRLAKRFAELVSVPSVGLDASTGSPGFSIVGTERGWSSAQPGRPVEMILESRIANGIVIVDEICKGKSGESSKGKTFSFYDALLSLLEPESARRWECPFFRVSFDMSHLSWIFTSNVSGAYTPCFNKIRGLR
jgi:ATP-dependent Lon protease